MPVDVQQQDEQWCVVEPSGDVVPGGCHATEAAARDHAAAINANAEKLHRVKGGQLTKRDGRRIGGYLNVYTSQDDPDLTGEWFSKDTDFGEELGWTIKGKPVLIEHALDGAFKYMPVGIFELESEDDIGRWVEARLYDREEYERRLQQLRNKGLLDLSDEEIARKAALVERTVDAMLETGKVQWSSGALPQAVVVDEKTKHIKVWPRIEGSLTFTPAEPDGTEAIVLSKAFAELKSLLSYDTVQKKPVAPTAHKGDNGRNGAETDANGTQSKRNPMKVNESSGDAAVSGVVSASPDAAQPTTPTAQERKPMTVKKKKDHKRAIRDRIRQMLDDVVEEELATIVQEVAAEEGVPMDEAEAAEVAQEVEADVEEVVAEVVEEVAEAETDEPMAMDGNDDENEKKRRKGVDLRRSVMQRVYRSTYKRIGARKRAREDARKRARQQARQEYRASQKGVSRVGGFTSDDHEHPDGQTKRPSNVQVLSRYSKWKAADFSFAEALRQMQEGTNVQPSQRMKIDPDPEFYREFADKAAAEHQKGTLHLSSGAMKTINAIKADELNYSTQTGYGDEWVPTVWSDDVWDKPRLDNVIPNILQTIEMPSNPYEYPVQTTDPEVYFVSETQDESALTLDSSNSAIPDSKVATSKVTFSAKKLAMRVMWSSELEEDAITRLVPVFREQAERAMRNAIDHVALNGDTSTSGNINLDGGTPGSTAKYLAYDGIIHQPLVAATSNRLDAGGAAVTLTHLRAVRKLLGDAEGYSPESLAWIMDYQTYITLMSDDTIVTMDKYGDQATVVTGELGRIDGTPVFVSAEMALADTDGKITDGGNTADRGRAILLHRPSWLMGYRRRVQQALEFKSVYDAWILTITMRNDLKVRTASNGTQQSTDDSTAILYNIGV